MKSTFSKTIELLVATFVLLSTMLCVYPQEGLFFKWWEDHSQVLMLGLFGAGLLFFMLNFRRLMIVTFGACAVLCLVLEERSQILLQHAAITQEPSITIGQFELSNVQRYDDEHLKLILQTNADIISLQEVEWSSLEKVHNFFTCCGYPYYECMQNEARETALVLYSKFPFTFMSEVNDSNALGILGRIEWVNGDHTQDLFLFSAFVNAAKNEHDQVQLRKRLGNYAHRLSALGKPLLAFGDYRLVTWSRDLNRFRTVAGLQESRRGMLPAYPYARFSPFDFPFDHIFYSNHFKCVSFETISSASTDHLGIVGTYQFENQDSIVNVQTTAQEL